MQYSSGSPLTRVSLALLVTLVSLPAVAGISGVQGTFADGSTVTIQGSGFGSKSNAKPLYYWDFSKSASTSPLSRNTYSNTMRGSLSTSVKAPNSSSALRVDMSGGNTNSAGPDGVNFSSNSAYVWIKRNYNFNAATGGGKLNLKHIRFWAPWTHDTYAAYLDSSALAFAEHTGQSSVWYSLTQPKNAWTIDEFDYQNSGIGTADGYFMYLQSGVGAWSFSQKWTFRNSSYPASYSLIALDQISNNALPSGSYLYYDAVYIDDSRQRVIISTEPTWRETTSESQKSTREIQIPTAWSDTSIQIAVRQGSFSDFSGKYLYVIGTNGKPVNSTGFQVCNNCSTPVPNPPTEVAVQ